jgi:PAS domain S-box-containing protein
MDRQTGKARFTVQGEGDKGLGQRPKDSFEKMEKDVAASPPRTMKTFIIIAAIGIGLVGFWLTSRVSYLLFHSLAELFSVLVAWGMFLVAWNSRRFLTHSFFLFLGVAFLGAGALDLLHMLSFKGMGVFVGATADLPTQLWIAARGLEAVSLLMAPLFLTRRISALRLLSAYILVGGLLLSAVFGGWFPACYVEGQGLTAFKISSEYLICVVLAGAIFFVYRRRQHLDPTVLRLVMASMAVSIVSELSFTMYLDVYGLFNQLGHFLKIFAFALLYKAIIATGLQQPYRTLFRELAQSEALYRKLFDTMTEGFALHEIICDDQGRPCDYRFLQVNPAFERLTGLRAANLVGRTLYEVLPQSESLWVERYGSVALTGQPVHFDQWNKALGRHFEVSAFQTERGYFGVVFIDVTERKQAEKALRTSRLAALNLMEDAVEARQKAEQISSELETRVRERTAELSEVVQKLEIENLTRQRLEDTLRASEQQIRFFASQCLKAQETERRKIAAELHDSIAASLAAIKFSLERIQAEMTQGLAAPESLQGLVATIQQTIVETRRIMSDLRPAILDDLGIIAALSWFCREFQKTYSHIRIESEIGLSEEDLPDSLKTPVFRISQEALNNIAKHSQTGRVHLSLRKENAHIELLIQDHGRGFDWNKVVKGFGLSTMRERAELSGGEFILESVEGKGTIIRASWPLP